MNLLDGVIENLKQRKCSFTDKQKMLIKKLIVDWPVEKCFPALDLLSDIAGLDFNIATNILPLESLLEGFDFSNNMTRAAQIIAMLKLRCLSNIISHKSAIDLVIPNMNNVVILI
jgi:capsule polysaccharide export protein KpsC/LpsZ